MPKIFKPKILCLEFGTNAKFKKIWQNLPEKEIIAKTKLQQIKSDHNQVFFRTWKEIATTISKDQVLYNGFVIFYSGEFIDYSIAAISFMLAKLKKPIIFAHIQKGNSTNVDELGKKAEILNAIQVATEKFAGTVLLSGQKIIHGLKVVQSRSDDHKFDSVDDSNFGSIDMSINISEEYYHYGKEKIKPDLDFSSLIAMIDLFPSVADNLIANLNHKKLRGIIIKNGSELSDFSMLRSDIWSKLNIPLVLFNPKSRTNIPSKFIVIGDMTLPTTYIKFMWALGKSQNIDTIRIMMRKNYFGEIYKS